MWREFQDVKGYGIDRKLDGGKVQECMGVAMQWSYRREWCWWKMVMAELGGARMLNGAERDLDHSVGLVR